MKCEINRRYFLKNSIKIPFIAVSTMSFRDIKSYSQEKFKRIGGPRIKISCNTYSYNYYLMNGKMTLDDLLELCANLGFDAIDLTGYYFPNYPDVPPDEYIYHIKRKSFLLGLDIGGTGVRNDFTNPDKDKRKADIEHIKKWIVCAQKLGAPLVRIFSGQKVPEGFTREVVTEWIVDSIKECADYAGKYGVMIAIQNHDDFLKTADQLLEILKAINSEWVGLMVDTGSFKTNDPYEEIVKVASYAITWQIKELVTVQGRYEKINLNKIVQILKNVNYRGYIPIEHIGEGDPKIIMPEFLKEVRTAVG